MDSGGLPMIGLGSSANFASTARREDTDALREHRKRMVALVDSLPSA